MVDVSLFLLVIIFTPCEIGIIPRIWLADGLITIH